MATLKERSDNWGATSIKTRDFRHDHGDGYDETKHKKTHHKARPQKKPGCRGNNGKAHVYVWVSSLYVPNELGRYISPIKEKWAYKDHPEYQRFYGWMPWKNQEEHREWLTRREEQVCCGCYKKSGKKRMKDDQSQDRNWWYFYC